MQRLSWMMCSCQRTQQRIDITCNVAFKWTWAYTLGYWWKFSWLQIEQHYSYQDVPISQNHAEKFYDFVWCYWVLISLVCSNLCNIVSYMSIWGQSIVEKWVHVIFKIHLDVHGISSRTSLNKQQDKCYQLQNTIPLLNEAAHQTFIPGRALSFDK